jgi:hypothetical protein
VVGIRLHVRVHVAVTIGYFSGEAPVRLFVLIILTNWLWIPVIAYYDLAIRRRR